MTDQWYLTTIRHGVTDYNKEERYAGSIDVPLNETGKNDVSEVAPFIRSMEFDVALVSPLRRATETAELLTEGRVEIVTSPHAQERNYGILQGCAFADVEQIRPPIHFIKVGNDYHSLNPPQAETFEELRARAEVFCDDIMSRYRGKRILVVSHSAFLQQFHGFLRGKDWIESLGTPVRNLELTTFHFEDERMISEDRRHLTTRKQGNF